MTTPRTILIVEDDPFLRTSLALFLQATDPDVAVSQAGTLTKAIETMHGSTFDLFFVDYLLGGNETGVDFWEACIEHATETPFVLFSSVPFAEVTEEIMKRNLPIPLFVPKPLGPKNLSLILSWFIK